MHKDVPSAPQPPPGSAHFGPYGGSYVPETLVPALRELELAFERWRVDPEFRAEWHGWLRDYVGRPSALYEARRLARHCGGARLFFKREDLNHTGAHKINNTIGQILLASRMGKRRIIAETGAGQHGVATATAAALFDLPATIYMGAEDVARQQPNVLRMRYLGAEVVPVLAGSRTLKDAINEAIRDWVTNVDDTFYLFGTAAGPHPFPRIVREFQRVIGDEARAQFLERCGALPSECIACVGGGSNAIGLFAAFLDDRDVQLVGVEAAGHGMDTGRHAAPLSAGSVGVLHGAKSYLLQTPEGQIAEAHSISAGLDYPGVGPEHAWLKDQGRARYVTATDAEALEAAALCARLEGILPALETAHALAYAFRRAREGSPSETLLVNLSGRGDKDMQTYLAPPSGGAR